METIIVSDLHLSDREPMHPKRPLWKAYKHEKHFIDADFARLLEHSEREALGPLELVMNGDTFDFNNITMLPAAPEGEVGWLARRRGLGAEEWMSAFKMERIITDHPVWFDALRGFVERGNRAIFIIGNHDAELHWPRVQGLILKALGLSAESPTDQDRVVFCPWFYLSGGDTYVSHGNQYDPYCVVQNPIDPLIEVRGQPRVRLPFGDQAQRYMLNGMGYFNPHATSNFIMSAGQYAVFFFRYMLWTQPFLLWTWFWGAMATLIVTLGEHIRPAMRDPLYVEEKTASIAARAQATPAMVRKLNALHVASATTRPLMILRELWLDRGLLMIGLLLFAWQVVLTVNFVRPVSVLWGLVPVVLLSPALLIYAASVRSGIFQAPLLTEERASLIHRITGATRVVFGHTHEPERLRIGPIDYINGGFWSAAFADPGCTRRIGTQTYVRLRPDADGPREAELVEWPPGASSPAQWPRLTQDASESPASPELPADESPGEQAAPDLRSAPPPSAPSRRARSG